MNNKKIDNSKCSNSVTAVNYDHKVIVRLGIRDNRTINYGFYQILLRRDNRKRLKDISCGSLSHDFAHCNL